MKPVPKPLRADAEVKTVNRRAAILRVRKPYFEWARSVRSGARFTLEDLRKHPTIWLLPKDAKPEAFLRRNFDAIFAEELSGFEMSRWPAERTWEMFQQWFEIEIVHSVYDLGDNREIKSWR